jgi:alpha-glucosidase
MVEEWRTLIDNYNREKGGDTRVLFTEAYTNVEDTMRYYGEDGKTRAHFPFNFLLIDRLNQNSNAYSFKNEIDIWMTLLPQGATSNWVVSCEHSKTPFAL